MDQNREKKTSSYNKVDFEAQAVAIGEEDVHHHQSSSSNRGGTQTSLFAKFALAVGFLNAAILGVLVYEVRQLIPIGVFVSQHHKELDSFLSLTSYLNDFSIARLFHGSLPELLNDFITSDISGAAAMTQSFAQDVHSSICTSSSEKGDYPDLPNFYISKYASLVESISNQIANINSLDPAVDDQNEHDDDAPVQITGKGGMVLDTLTYAINFIKSQTDVSEWKTVACSCQDLATELASVEFKDTYGPDCKGASMQYDIQSKAMQYINSFSTTCATLCHNLAAADSEEEEETSSASAEQA
jgi:hypothetical protein